MLRTFDVGGQPFHVPQNYEPVRPVGHGAYGVVCCVRDNDQGGIEVAIKKVKVNADSVEAKRLLREMKLLRLLDHENVRRKGKAKEEREKRQNGRGYENEGG